MPEGVDVNDEKFNSIRCFLCKGIGLRPIQCNQEKCGEMFCMPCYEKIKENKGADDVTCPCCNDPFIASPVVTTKK